MTTCITVMGTGLALRGPDGSMVRAVEGAPRGRIGLSEIAKTSYFILWPWRHVQPESHRL